MNIEDLKKLAKELKAERGNLRTRVSVFAEGVLELIEKLKVAEEALEYIARGPRIDDSDSTVAKQALKKIRGEADES